MEIETSPGRALSSSFNLGDFKTRLGSIDPRRCSPTALPPPPPLCEEDEDRMAAAEEAGVAAAAAAAAGEGDGANNDASVRSADGEQEAGAGAGEDDMEPQVMGEAELREEVARAREAFMLRRWASILGQVKAAGGVEGVPELAGAEEPEKQGQGDNEEHLARLYAAAEGGLRELVAGCLAEEAQQGEAYDRLVERKAEVEALLGTLEAAQASLARQQEAQQRGGEESDDDDDVDDEEEEDDEAAEAETARLQAALAAARAEKGAVDGQAAALERQLEEMRQQGASQGETDGAADEEEAEAGEEGAGIEEEGDADSVSATGDEEALLREAAELREHGEWLETLLATLRQLYQVAVRVEEEDDDNEAEAAASTGMKKRIVILRVTYPSLHALEMTLTAATPVPAAAAKGEEAPQSQQPPQRQQPAVVALTDACMELPPQQARRKSVAVAEAARGLNQQAQALLALAKGLQAPEDLMFLARECGWVVQGKGVLRKEVRELMKRYVVKHSEAKPGSNNKSNADELTISFNEGVVATFGLLPGYPQMPGSVRIVSLVGIGGWKDADLAVTARSLNGLGLGSLTALVEGLQERLAEQDKGV